MKKLTDEQLRKLARRAEMIIFDQDWSPVIEGPLAAVILQRLIVQEDVNDA